MGKLIDGHWSSDGYKADDKGHFVREETKFRGTVTADGSSGFRAQAGRYHLYVSLACPWAHRTLVGRAVKRLEAVPQINPNRIIPIGPLLDLRAPHGRAQLR